MSAILDILCAPFFREAVGLVVSVLALLVLLLRRNGRPSAGRVPVIVGLSCLTVSFASGALSEIPGLERYAVLHRGSGQGEVWTVVLRMLLGLPLVLGGCVAGVLSSRPLFGRVRAPAPRRLAPAGGVSGDDVLAESLNLANRDLEQARAEVRRSATEASRVSEKLRETMNLLLSSEERFRTVFERVTDGLVLVDLETRRITLANPGMVELTGHAVAELQRMRFAEVFGPELAEKTFEEFREMAQRARLPAMALTRKDGGAARVEVALSLIVLGGRNTLLCAVRDVSMWERLKEDLETKNRALEEREERLEAANADMKDRAEQMRTMNEKLRELQRVKDDFLSSVSHELRTPLTSIRSFSEILLDHPDAEDGVKQEFLSIINKESERLTRLINDVLDLAKIEAGAVRMKTTRVDLRSLAAEVMRALAPLAQEKNLRVDRDLPTDLPAAEGDRDKLQQILTNLASNAIRFSRPGSRVRISARLRPEGDLCVSVADEGPGIPADQMPGIFEKFRQGGEAAGEQHAGTGLGLAICRELVAMHGGRIWGESVVGRGTIFHFTVRACEAPGHAVLPGDVPADLMLPGRRRAGPALPPLRAVSEPARGTGAQSLPPLATVRGECPAPG